MEGYHDYCPMSRAAEIFATRWTPLIVRNMLMGCRTFSELRDATPGISRTLLTQRLRLLEHHGVIARVPDERGHVGYCLTPTGQELAPVVEALARWGERWIELAPEHFDASKVMWALSRYADSDELPADRTVLRFDVTAPARETFWLLLEHGHVEVCRHPPGDEDDLVVRASAEALARWHLGELELGAALHAGTMEVHGPRELERLLVAWGGGASVDAVFGAAAV